MTTTPSRIGVLVASSTFEFATVPTAIRSMLSQLVGQGQRAKGLVIVEIKTHFEETILTGVSDYLGLHTLGHQGALW